MISADGSKQGCADHRGGPGQGRGHAVRLAQEGADVIAVDICRQIDAVAYPLATRATWLRRCPR